MKNNTLALRIIFVLLIVAIQTRSFASHILGLDLYYTYVSGNTYKITLIAYGDCAGSAFPTLQSSAPVVCIYDGSTSVSSVTLSIQPPTTGVEISPVCPGTITQCTSASSSIPGIKKFVYSANYTLPHTSSLWRFVFTGNMGAASAGRSASVTNILSGTISQIEDTLNNSVHPNSNPILTVLPTPYYCLNNTDVYNPGAVDADGDRLNFSLISGMNGTSTCSPGAPVTYTGMAWPGTPVSGATPLQVATGTFLFNPLTGQISFYPNVTQRSLIVYNVREFRGDTFMGSCQREMNFLVQPCTSLPPTGSLTSATAGTILDSTDFQICAGTGSYSVFMNPTEADTTNLITVTSSGLPAGATFTTTANGTNHPHCTFSWTTAGVTPGTYVFYVTFTDNNCPINGSLTRAYTITVLPNPIVTASGRATICIGASVTLSASGSSTGYVWSGSGLSCTTCSSPVANPTSTMLYTVSTTGTCTTRDTVRVTVNPRPTVDAGTPTNICPGNSISLSPTGATTYVWLGAGLSCSSCTSPVASPTVTTVYTVTGTDANGCINSDTIRITVGLPLIDAGAPVNICTGSSGTLTATGGATYTWSPGIGLSCTACGSPTVNPVSTTVYTVTGTDIFGCNNTDTVRVTVNSLPVIDAGAPINICIGTSATLLPTGGSTYFWSGPGLSCGSCTSPTATPAATSVYTVVGTDIHGCTGSDTMSVTVNLLPAIDAGPHITVCAGSSATLTPSGGVSYTWSGTGLSCTSCTSPIATPAATTIYTVTGTGTGGCSNTDTLSITVNPLPLISGGGSHTICNGGSTTLTASGGTVYTWTPGTSLSCTSCTSPIANPATTTLYTVTGTNAFGCVNRDTARVIVMSRITVAAPGIAICTGSSGLITATGATTYSWLPATALSCTACASPTASPATTATYTVIGVSGVCADTTTVTVTVNPRPAITALAPSPKCFGQGDTLTAIGGIRYSWSPAGGMSCATCAITTVIPASTTAYTVTGYNGYGCSNTAVISAVINSLPMITVAPAPAVICYGSSVTLTAGGAFTYSWAPSTGLSAAAGSTVVASPGSTIVYTITGTDANNCVSSVTDIVTVNPIPPAPVVVSPVSYCQSAPASALTATGSNLLWYTAAAGSSGSSTAPIPSTATVGATTYYVSQTVNGCESPLAPITVIIYTNAQTDFDFQVKLGCLTDTVLFTSSSQDVNRLYWSFGDGTHDTASSVVHYYPASVRDNTYFTVRLHGYNPSCYDDSTTKNVSLPIAHFMELYDVTPDQVIHYGTSVQLNARGADTYFWIPNDGSLDNNSINNPVAKPKTDETYIVYGRIKEGCEDSAVVHIKIIYPEGQVVPDAFSPNGDGLNDVFRIINLGFDKLDEFRIYNRWGQVVFETNDMTKGWDGTFLGVPQELGAYFYTVTVSRANGEKKFYKGDMTLIR